MQGSTLKWKKGGFRKLCDLAALNISQSQKSESDVACLEVQRILQQIVNQFSVTYPEDYIVNQN